MALAAACALALAGGCRPAAAPAPLAESPAVPIAAPAGLGSNALERVARLLTLGPRDAGTPGAARAARWLASELRAAGLEARIDSFADATPEGDCLFHNVLAYRPGRISEWVVLLSHYDTKSGIGPGFLGANDSGSSTGLLLELAALLARRPPPEYGLAFAFLDGEECKRAYGEHDGLHGSKRLARQLRERGERVRAVILLDMVGDAHLTFTLPRNGTPALKLLLLDAAAAQGCRERVQLLEYDILDDHQPFLEAGFPAVNLIDFHFGSRPGRNDFWHTPEDTLDKLSPATLQTVGAVTLEMLARLEDGRYATLSRHASRSEVGGR